MSGLGTVPGLLMCNVKGEVYDSSGGFICKYIPLKSLGEGTFGYVDLFNRKDASGSTVRVAMKRPKFAESKLLDEASFQRDLHTELLMYGLSACVPKVYDIFTHQPTGDVWFTMEAYEPVLVSQWSIKSLEDGDKKGFALLLLQIALIIEVLEIELKIDHRDLKINNMIVVDEPVTIDIKWKGVAKSITFPFRIVIVDFGFACQGKHLDVRRGDGLPPLDACPKEGRNIFQVLVSLWNIQSIRSNLGESWTRWFHNKISEVFPLAPCVSLAESSKSLDWMYSLTENREFRAPRCIPQSIIRDCMRMVDFGKN